MRLQHLEGGAKVRIAPIPNYAEEDMNCLIKAPNNDIFEVLTHVRFSLAPLGRSKRANQALSIGLSGVEGETPSFF